MEKRCFGFIKWSKLEVISLLQFSLWKYKIIKKKNFQLLQPPCLQPQHYKRIILHVKKLTCNEFGLERQNWQIQYLRVQHISNEVKVVAGTCNLTISSKHNLFKVSTGWSKVPIQWWWVWCTFKISIWAWRGSALLHPQSNSNKSWSFFQSAELQTTSVCVCMCVCVDVRRGMIIFQLWNRPGLSMWMVFTFCLHAAAAAGVTLSCLSFWVAVVLFLFCFFCSGAMTFEKVGRLLGLCSDPVLFYIAL